MIAPMLCHDPRTKDEPLPGDGWIIEPKLDGWRFLFWRATAGSPVKVRSYAGRNGSERTGQPAAIERLLEFLPPDTIIDAELVVPGEKSPRVAHALAHGQELHATVFDVLRVAGTDVIGLSWKRRRSFVDRIADGFDGELVAAGEFQEPDEGQHQEWIERGHEGSVAKRIDSLYVPGVKSWDWIKFKPQLTACAEVVGFVEGKGERTGTWGAFQIRLLDSGVETTVACTIEQSRQAEDYLGRVVEFSYQYLMDSGKPRHPVKPVLREDRDPVAA
jgi:ATP-dependent DNA ligase